MSDGWKIDLNQPTNSSVSSLITKHAQVSRNMYNKQYCYGDIILCNSYCCLPSCLWIRSWPSNSDYCEMHANILISLHTIAIAVGYAGFGQGTGPVLLSNVGCTGTESSLLSCSHRVAYCSHSRDAGVVCPSCESCI